ncbi:MAG: MBL fold metallo-hydrolase [Halobacteriales archaeon]
MTEPREVVDDVYAVDTRSYGHERHTAAYLVDASEPALVETGLSTTRDRVVEALAALDVEPRYVVVTHVHLDHAGAAGYLLEEYPDAELVVREQGSPYLTDPDETERLVDSVHRAVGELADVYGDARAVDPERARAIKPGDEVDLGDRELRAVDAPGHAPHQVALLDTESGSLFTGDEAGMYLDGRLVQTTPPPNFDLDANVDSLRRFRDLEPERLVYTHYGVRDDVYEALDEYENTLQNWVKQVRSTLRDRGDADAAVEALVERADEWAFPDDWSDRHVRETVRMDATGVLLYLGEL